MPKEDRDPEVMDAYQPTHRVINVSDPSWKATLAKLYPQATVDKDYLKGLFNSVNDAGHSLYFAIFRHNEDPCTSNLFTHREDLPVLYQDLQKVMKASPTVCMLIHNSVEGECLLMSRKTVLQCIMCGQEAGFLHMVDITY
jgi:hypothetical protein